MSTRTLDELAHECLKNDTNIYSILRSELNIAKLRYRSKHYFKLRDLLNKLPIKNMDYSIGIRLIYWDIDNNQPGDIPNAGRITDTNLVAIEDEDSAIVPGLVSAAYVLSFPGYRSLGYPHIVMGNRVIIPFPEFISRSEMTDLLYIMNPWTCRYHEDVIVLNPDHPSVEEFEYYTDIDGDDISQLNRLYPDQHVNGMVEHISRFNPSFNINEVLERMKLRTSARLRIPSIQKLYDMNIASVELRRYGRTNTLNIFMDNPEVMAKYITELGIDDVDVSRDYMSCLVPDLEKIEQFMRDMNDIRKALFYCVPCSR